MLEKYNWTSGLSSSTCTDERTRGIAGGTSQLGQETDGRTSIFRNPSVTPRPGVRFENGRMQDRNMSHGYDYPSHRDSTRLLVRDLLFGEEDHQQRSPFDQRGSRMRSAWF